MDPDVFQNMSAAGHCNAICVTPLFPHLFQKVSLLIVGGQYAMLLLFLQKSGGGLMCPSTYYRSAALGRRLEHKYNFKTKGVSFERR